MKWLFSFVVGLLFFMPSVAKAQSLEYTIEGVVKDLNGNPLSATVTVEITTYQLGGAQNTWTAQLSSDAFGNWSLQDFNFVDQNTVACHAIVTNLQKDGYTFVHGGFGTTRKPPDAIVDTGTSNMSHP